MPFERVRPVRKPTAEEPHFERIRVEPLSTAERGAYYLALEASGVYIEGMEKFSEAAEGADRISLLTDDPAEREEIDALERAAAQRS